ncbi:MAG: hypothetical protein IKO68_10320 [Oscillospiraceae bacterium]|nr:hypothetical protein [Oscillospiraceae bacterium]
MSDVTREEFDSLRRQVAENTERLHRGDTTLALLDQRLGQIDDKLSELTTGVKALQEKPAKHWDSIVSKVVDWAVMLLLGFIAIKVGL